MHKPASIFRTVVIQSAVLLAGALLIPALLTVFSGNILRLIFPDAAPYFLQLHSARISWHPALLIAFAGIVCGCIFLLEIRSAARKGLWKVILGLLLLTAALCTQRVNGLPIRTAVSIIRTMAEGGFL